ncbi:MAG: hypothetical protein V4587_07315 [Acidobacteriota bacterium]
MTSHFNRTIRTCLLAALVAAPICYAQAPDSGKPATAPASPTISWVGHTWKVTTGHMAGVALGNPANVSIDSDGYLHLRIVNRDGTYTASEVFSTDMMGYGTYQWWIQGAVDDMDKATVLGLFPYGPVRHIGKDAEDELDIEFSKWNNTLCKGACNADFTFYPATGQIALGPTERDFDVNLHGGKLVTARLVWTPTRVTGTVMSGLQPIGTTAHVLKTWTFEPTDPKARIPQQPMPTGMNLWCFKVLPTSDQEVVLRDFKFVPQ